MGKWNAASAQDERLAAERLREYLNDRIKELSDEDRKWVDKVMAMSDEDAKEAISERRFRTVMEESDRRDYEHFLTQIP